MCNTPPRRCSYTVSSSPPSASPPDVIVLATTANVLAPSLLLVTHERLEPSASSDCAARMRGPEDAKTPASADCRTIQGVCCPPSHHLQVVDRASPEHAGNACQQELHVRRLGCLLDGRSRCRRASDGGRASDGEVDGRQH